MSSELKLRRGTTLQHSTFVGADSEITFNTDTNELVSHDGVTPGGFSGGGYLPAGTGAVATTVQAKLRESVSVKDFGAGPAESATTNDSAFVLALASGAGEIQFDGDLSISQSISVPANTQLVGQGPNSIIRAVADIVPVVIAGAFAGGRNFRVTKTGAHTKSGVEIGNSAATLNGGRAVLSGITVDGMGADGILVHNGNLGTLRDIVSINNGQDGIRFSNSTPDNNTWKLEGFLDLRGNARDGLHFDQGSSAGDVNAPKSNSANLIVAQQNGRYGLYCGTRSNHFVIYAEANTTADIYLDTYGIGNDIVVTEGTTITDVSGNNAISWHNSNSSYWRSMLWTVRLTDTKGLEMGNQVNAGSFKLYHDAAALHKFYMQSTGQAQTLRWKNTAGLANVDTDASIYAFIHDFKGAAIARERLVFTNADTTPDVSLSEFWLANNTGVTTITTFDGGQTGQVITVVFNNGNTTIQHSAAISGIRLKGGVNKTFAQYEGTQFIKNGVGWWVEV